MDFSKESIQTTLQNYEALYEKISEIVALHGEVDECYYEINEIELHDTVLTVNVEYYKWQDNNDHLICIDIELITDESAFHAFKKDMLHTVEQRKKQEAEKMKQEKNLKIQAAIELLEKNGFGVNENPQEKP